MSNSRRRRILTMFVAILVHSGLMAEDARCEKVRYSVQSAVVGELDGAAYLQIDLPEAVLGESYLLVAEGLLTLDGEWLDENVCLMLVPVNGAQTFGAFAFVPEGDQAVLARRSCPVSRGDRKVFTFSVRRILERRTEGGFDATGFVIGAVRGVEGCDRFRPTAVQRVNQGLISARLELWLTQPDE